MATLFDNVLKEIFPKTFKPRKQMFMLNSGNTIFFKSIISKLSVYESLGLSLIDTTDNKFNNWDNIFLTFSKMSLDNNEFKKQIEFLNMNSNIIDEIINIRNSIMKMKNDNSLLNWVLESVNNQLISNLIHYNDYPFDNVKSYESIDIVYLKFIGDEIVAEISLLKNIAITYNFQNKKWGFKVNPYDKFVLYSSEEYHPYDKKINLFESNGEFTFTTLIDKVNLFLIELKKHNSEHINKWQVKLNKIKSEEDLFLLSSILQTIESGYWKDDISSGKTFNLGKILLKKL